MQSKAKTVEEYLKEIPADRAEAFAELRKTILENLPQGFAEEMSYGMIGYVVPHSTYPSGYHCNPKLPLPFINLGSQKNAITLHCMGIYANPELQEWFVNEYPKHAKLKPDIGKGCIRFKNPGDVPFKLIGELMQKTSVQDWIELYEKNYKRAK